MCRIDCGSTLQKDRRHEIIEQWSDLQFGAGLCDMHQFKGVWAKMPSGLKTLEPCVFLWIAEHDSVIRDRLYGTKSFLAVPTLQTSSRAPFGKVRLTIGNLRGAAKVSADNFTVTMIAPDGRGLSVARGLSGAHWDFITLDWKGHGSLYQLSWRNDVKRHVVSACACMYKEGHKNKSSVLN